MKDSLFDDARCDAQHLLDAAVDAARAAGKIIMEGLDKRHTIDYKGQINLVTEVDVASQKCIVDRLRARFPDHVFWAEEEENHSPVDAPYLWLIDPLDGTTNYAHGYRCFSISIAFLIRGALAVGVVYDPWGDELFSAIRGYGAFVNGRQAGVSQETDLEKSLLVTGFPYDIREAEITNIGLFNHFVVRAQAVRRDGSAALDLAYVAAGRFDGFWELKLHPWDMAAGVLLVQEAGGRVSTFNGGDFHVRVFDLLATNGKIHDAMIGEIGGIARERW